MDDATYNNWVLIKRLMETQGKTDSFFYKRACQIVVSRHDPGAIPPTFGANGASNLP